MICPVNCRYCASHRPAFMPRKTPVSCWWVPSNPKPSPGVVLVSHLISVSMHCPMTSIILNRCSNMRCTAYRCLKQRGFRHFSMVRRVLRRTIVTIWVKRQKFGVCLWLQDLIQPVFSHPVVRVRSWQNGSGTDILRLTCGTWISGEPCHFSPTCVICTIGQPNPLACCTRCTGHFGSPRPHALSGVHPYTSTWLKRMLVSGKPAAGSGPTGLHLRG